MRKGLLAGVLALFALWFVVEGRAVPGPRAPGDLRDADRPADRPDLARADRRSRAARRACTDQIPWGPDARYVQLTLTAAPSGPRRRCASWPPAPATARPRGCPRARPATCSRPCAIAPARTEIPDGKLCVVNEGRSSGQVVRDQPGPRLGSVDHDGGRQADRPGAQRHAADEPLAVADRAARDDRIAHRGLPPADGLAGLLAGAAGRVRRAGRRRRGAGARGAQDDARGDEPGRRASSLSPARGCSSRRSRPPRAPR